MKRMMSVLDWLFIAAFILVIAGPFSLRALKSVGVALPTDMGLNKKVSNLEGRVYTQRPSPSAQSFMSRSFQEQAEDWASDKIPWRDDILLANAEIQRGVIACAAHVCGYETYPTFYGSTVAYSESQDSLFGIPSVANKAFIKACRQSASLLNEFASKHSGIDCYFYVTPHKATREDSPAAQLMSAPATNRVLQKEFTARLRGVTVIDSTVSSEEFRNMWSRSDHHWRIEGAYNAYSRTVKALGFDPKRMNEHALVTYREPVFYGSLSRTGRCLACSDSITDYALDLGDLRVSLDGKAATIEDLAHRQMYTQRAWDDDLFKNRYAEYYHGDYGEMAIDNDAAESRRTLLLVADSFSNSMERFYAQHYQHVLVYDARHNKTSLDEYVRHHPEIDDMLFLMWQGNITSDAFAASLR